MHTFLYCLIYFRPPKKKFNIAIFLYINILYFELSEFIPDYSNDSEKVEKLQIEATISRKKAFVI